MTIWKAILKILNKINKKRKLSKYNDFTISEYFRKQEVRVGKDNRIEIRSFGPEPYLVKIGNHCTIGPNVAFLTHDGGTWLFTEEVPDLQKFGTIEIRDNCFLGSSVIVLGDVCIGPNSIVGAGAVVTKDVPPNVVAAGNPAEIICGIEEYQKKVFKKWELQKPDKYFNGIKREKRYSPADIQKYKNSDLLILRNHLEKTLWNKSN